VDDHKIEWKTEVEMSRDVVRRDLDDQARATIEIARRLEPERKGRLIVEMTLCSDLAQELGRQDRTRVGLSEKLYHIVDVK
jgi:hypothetical protein